MLFYVEKQIQQIQPYLALLDWKTFQSCFFYATAIEDQNLTKRSYKRYFFCFFLYSVAIEDQNLTSLKKEATRGVFLVFSLHICIWWSKFDNPQKKLLEVPLLRFSLHSFIWGSKFDNPKKNNLLEVSFLFFLN